MPGHSGQPLRLGPRSQHVHAFSLDLRTLSAATFAQPREIGRTGVGLPQQVSHTYCTWLQLSHVGFPLQEIDVVVDDADHFKSTQLHNLDIWFPRLRSGGALPRQVGACTCICM